ncbi:hypothetical protein ACFL4O_02620, partial [bacterium]
MKKIISKIVLITFTSIILNDFAWAQNGAVVYEPLFIPSNLGRIIESYNGGTRGKIICIQDLHCHPNVQDTIYQIIRIVKRTYNDRFNIVGIEGAFTDIDTSIIGAIPDEEIKKDISQFYLKRGDISGAELYSIMDPGGIILRGVEDEEEYIKDFDLLYKSIINFKNITDIIEKIKMNFSRSKKY